jgi:hypothetical protein
MFASSRKLQDKKDKIASTRVDPEGRWENFSEASLLDNIDDKREEEEENVNTEVAASNSNIDSDDNNV